jgi:hypothetical protein
MKTPTNAEARKLIVAAANTGNWAFSDHGSERADEADRKISQFDLANALKFGRVTFDKDDGAKGATYHVTHGSRVVVVSLGPLLDGDPLIIVTTWKR